MSQYREKIKIEKLAKIEPLLEKHYGLGISYFARFWDKKSDYIELEFPCSEKDFLSCFKSERKFLNKKGNTKLKKCDLPNIPENELILDTIWIIMSVCTREDISIEKPSELSDYVRGCTPEFEDHEDFQLFMSMYYSDFLCEFYEAAARIDLLELYIYHKRKRYYWNEPTEITIKYGHRRAIKIENKDNWFENVLLSNHFKKYLPDIKSEQDAIKALNAIKHPGRGLARPLLYHFLYGTYRMVSEHIGKETVTESFCELILSLLEQMDYPLTYIYSGGLKKGEVKEIDSQYIRKMISKLKQQSKKYKFNIGLVLHGKDALEALKQSGRNLYDEMILDYDPKYDKRINIDIQ